MSQTSPLTPPIDLTKTFSIEQGKDQPVDREKVKQMAQEFESMLLLQMVRQMRQSMVPEDEEAKENGFGNETLTDTFDVEFARYLAKAGGVGLAKTIEAQMEKSSAKPDAASASGASTAAAPTAAPASTPVSMPHPAAAPAVAAPVAPTPSSPAPLTKTSALTESSASTVSSSSPSSADSSGPATLAMPIDADSSSRFGWRSDPFQGRRKFHHGLDLRAAYGTEVASAGDGTVTFAGERGGYGLMVVVEHEHGLQTRYAHLASADVQPGERIGAGQTLGRVGSSGRSTGPHLHFEVLQDGQRVDPERVAARGNAND